MDEQALERPACHLAQTKLNSAPEPQSFTECASHELLPRTVVQL